MQAYPSTQKAKILIIDLRFKADGNTSREIYSDIPVQITRDIIGSGRI